LAGPEGAGNGAEAQPRKARPPLAGGAAKEMKKKRRENAAFVLRLD
jgi:hypothetical protein